MTFEYWMVTFPHPEHKLLHTPFKDRGAAEAFAKHTNAVSITHTKVTIGDSAEEDDVSIVFDVAWPNKRGINS